MAINQLQIPGYAAPQSIDLATPLAQLGQVYRQAQNRQSLSELGRGLANGTIDFKQAAGRAADMGDVDTSLKFLALDEQRRRQAQETEASNQFTTSLGSLYGGGQQPAPQQSVGVPNVAPPNPMPRAPVASTPKVWGDQEATNAGLYDAPAAQPRTQVAQAKPAAALPPVGTSDGLSPRAIMLMQGASNPRLPQAQRDFAKTMLTHELDNSKLTPSQKEYVMYRSQGGTDDFTTWDRGNKAASKTEVNINNKAEGKFEEKLGEGQAKRFNEMVDAGVAAERKLTDIDAMRQISLRIGSQGATANLKEAVGPYAEALGVNIEGLSDIQAYSSIVQRLAPQQRAPGSGSTSDIEFKGFLKSLPTLSQNPAAREVTLNTMEALTRDEIDRGRIASRVASGELSRRDAERELRALPDPMKSFTEWRKANGQAYGQALKAGDSPNQGPKAGTVEDGYRFKGGDPSNPANWVKQ